jgi:hypothetical protein
MVISKARPNRAFPSPSSLNLNHTSRQSIKALLDAFPLRRSAAGMKNSNSNNNGQRYSRLASIATITAGKMGGNWRHEKIE